MAEMEFKGKARRARTPRAPKQSEVAHGDEGRWIEGSEIVTKGDIQYRVSVMERPADAMSNRVYRQHKILCTTSGGFFEEDKEIEQVKFFTPVEEFKKRSLAEEARIAKITEPKAYANDGLVRGSREMEVREERPMTGEDFLRDE